MQEKNSALIHQNSYRWSDNWLKIPAHIKLGITHGIKIGPANEIYLLHTVAEDSRCRDTVCVFSSDDGSFIRSWGEAFQGSAHGLHLHQHQGQAFVYITDLKRGLFKLTLEGDVVWRVAKPKFYENRPHLAYEPTNVAVTPDGHIFLADGYGSYLINHFDAKGRELDTFGGPGLRKNNLAHPHGLIYTERRGSPELLIAENIETRLNYLSLEGEHRGFIDVETRRPRHFSETEDLLVIPDFYGRVTLLDRNDELIGHLGDTWIDHDHAAELEADPPAQGFVRPHDAAVGQDGSIYVAEYLRTGRVVRLKPID